MSYTNIELVRHHLDAPFPIQERIRDQVMVLEGDEYVVFFGGAVQADSVNVKSVRGNDLTRTTLAVTGSKIVVSGTPIVRGSVLAASDSSLGEVYAEGEDFVVDYNAGVIAIKEDGAISIGRDLTVWYQAYHLHSSGADYLIDASRGSIKRVSSGSIGDGETIYLDYTPLFASYREELLENAVVEANALVEKAVDPSREFGADPVLQQAATYRALEIVCRASAGQELSSLNRSDKPALAWMKLADDYGARSEKLVSSFRPPRTGPSAPVRS